MAEATPAAANNAMVWVGRGREAWTAMPKGRQVRLIAALGFLLAVVAGVGWWSTRTDWRVLYQGLEPRDAAQVQSELAAAGVTYRTTLDGGTVEVPAEMMDKARMEVATKGMPGSGRMGFELFDKPNWVGSDFEEKVNYQRAMEGELEHTIASVGAVSSARVHLVMPKDSLFSGEAQPAKASVVLKLKGSSLGREGAESIRNLVAGAVEGLAAANVTLVDADGRVNLNTPGRNEQTGAEEELLQSKLVSVLEPIAGHESVRATVTLRYDSSAQERTDEIVDPKEAVAVSTQRSEQVQNGNVRGAQGVPGTSSNAPNASAPNSVANAAAAGNAAGTAAVAAANGDTQAANPAAANGTATQAQTNANNPLPVYPTAGQQGGSLHEESNSYAVTRHTIHQEQGPGRLARLTAAVVVNDRAVVEGTGKNAHTVWKPRSPEELKRLQDLAQAVVGFDAQRGDSVVVENIGFMSNVPEAPAPAGMERWTAGASKLLRTQPELLRWAGGGVLALLLLTMVVRPVAKSAVALLQAPAQLPASTSVDGNRVQLAPDNDTVELTSVSSAADPLPPVLRRPPALENRGLLDQVGGQIRRDPTESTRLLEAWLHEKPSAAGGRG